jgi:hypothetical protein
MALGTAPRTERSQVMAEVRADVDVALERLLGRAFLFDDPSAFEAGVREAVELLATVGAGTAQTAQGYPGEMVGSDRVSRGA